LYQGLGERVYGPSLPAAFEHFITAPSTALVLPETPPLLEMDYENKGSTARKAICLAA